MKYFTKDDINILMKYEYYFSTVIKYNYKRNTTRQINDEVADVYERTTNEKLSRNYSCSSCVFNIFKTVGKLYFDSIEYWKNEDKKALEQPKNNKVEQLSTEPPKKGRKPLKSTKKTTK